MTPPDDVEWGIAKVAVGHLVRRVHLKSQAVYASVFEPLGLTSFQLGVLELASRNAGLTQRRLADLILVDPSIIVGAVDELEARGYLKRRRSAEDRRAFCLEVTKEGLAVRDKLLAAADRAEDLLLEGLTPKERKALVSTLAQIARM